MPHYKLYHYDVPQRAEPSRILLSLANADWEDVRISITDKDSAKKIKPKCPYGQLPILEFDEVVLGQSRAILRYLAKTFEFVPKTNLQSAIADGVVDQIEDWVAKDAAMYHEKDPSEKQYLCDHSYDSPLNCIGWKCSNIIERATSYVEGGKFVAQSLVLRLIIAIYEEQIKEQRDNLISRSLKVFEKILAENSGGKTFFFGDKITYADIHLFYYLKNIFIQEKLDVPDVLNEHPGLSKLYNGVMNEPKILAYLQKRQNNGQ